MSKLTLPLIRSMQQMQNYVFVIDKNQKPLHLVNPARARELLNKQKAAVFRLFPFTC